MANPSSANDTDVLIVGAGPTGLACGIELKRRGLQPKPDTENSFHIKDPEGFDLQISGKEMTASSLI